jgi:hypothetical protein
MEKSLSKRPQSYVITIDIQAQAPSCTYVCHSHPGTAASKRQSAQTGPVHTSLQPNHCDLNYTMLLEVRLVTKTVQGNTSQPQRAHLRPLW